MLVKPPQPDVLSGALPVSPSTSPEVLCGALSEQETDCACPIPPRRRALQPHPQALFVQAPSIYQAPLADGWTLFCNTLAGGAPAILNAAAAQRLATFSNGRLLDQPYDHKLAEARLLVPAMQAVAPASSSSDTLTAWLHVTNACNLECPYCYVRKSGARMQLADGMRAIDALLATAAHRQFPALKLKYAGGEAALHYRVVQQLHAFAVDRAHELGIALRSVVLSNGTVMPLAFADWLAANGVRLMLSVDGVGDDHDRQRPWKGQRDHKHGAFAALERNLEERLLPRGICPDISITVTGRTAHTAHTAVRWAIERDLPFSLNFYRESAQSTGYRELRLEERQIINGMLAAYQVIEELLPERPFLDGLLDRVQNEAHQHTCGVGQSYVVITHTGRAAQCQMELEHAQAFAQGEDLIRLVAGGPLHPVAVDQKEGCRDCSWRYRCAGGCPVETLRATGRIDIQSPNCGIYKALLPVALRLEGLRVLKVAAPHCDPSYPGI
jgi:uncharacterized protein